MKKNIVFCISFISLLGLFYKNISAVVQSDLPQESRLHKWMQPLLPQESRLHRWMQQLKDENKNSLKLDTEKSKFPQVSTLHSSRQPVNREHNYITNKNNFSHETHARKTSLMSIEERMFTLLLHEMRTNISNPRAFDWDKDCAPFAFEKLKKYVENGGVVTLSIQASLDSVQEQILKQELILRKHSKSAENQFIEKNKEYVEKMLAICAVSKRLTSIK